MCIRDSGRLICCGKTGPQSLLVAILHDYWLAKYVMHIMAVDWLPPAPDDQYTRHCLSTGTQFTSRTVYTAAVETRWLAVDPKIDTVQCGIKERVLPSGV